MTLNGRFAPLGFLLLFAGVLLAGCGRESVDTSQAAGVEDDYSNLELEDPLGGYEATDEPGLSNDGLLGDLVSSETLAGDPVAEEPSVSDALSGASDYNLYVVRLLWGVLPQEEASDLPPDAAPDVDWSGSLATTSGAIVALRTLRFDRGDEIVRPREDPQVLQFLSETHGHVDGLLIAVAVPADEDDGAGALTLETAPFSMSWSYAELDSANAIYESDVARHEVSLVSMKREAGACVQGFVMGNWHGDSLGRGVFRGVWLSFDGTFMGYLRGHYGVRSDGPNVLYGKFFDAGGGFDGFIRGSYTIERRNAGRFRAAWLDGSEHPTGFMKGHWTHVPRTRRGFFMGRWGSSCGEGSEG